MKFVQKLKIIKKNASLTVGYTLLLKTLELHASFHTIQGLVLHLKWTACE